MASSCLLLASIKRFTAATEKAPAIIPPMFSHWPAIWLLPLFTFALNWLNVDEAISLTLSISVRSFFIPRLLAS